MKAYPLYRHDNLRLLNLVIQTDEYDDAAKAEWTGAYYDDEYLEFLVRNVQGPNVLDVACGSGISFTMLPVTHAIDANPARANKARERGAGRVDVRLAAAEHLPFAPGSMQTVLHLHGFGQTRSDYETVMEANRVLEPGGRYIFDLFHLSRTNVEFGRIYEPRSYIRVMRDFGFEVVERRDINEWDTALCFEKVDDFDWKKMHKIQLIERADGAFSVKNLDPEDFTLR